MQLTVDSGQLPLGWIKTKLGDVCKKVEYGSSAKSKPKGEVPVIRMGNIQNGVIDWNDLVYTTDQEEIDKYLLKHNDILFNRTNSAEHVGKAAIYKSERPAIFAGYLIRIHRKEDLIDANFLNYYLNSNTVREYGKSVMSRSVNQANINGTKLKEYPILLPPLPEQKRIVAILDEAFEGIDRAIANTEKNLANSRELFESYLSAIFSQKSDGWVEKTIGEVCKLSQGLAINSKTKFLLVSKSSLPLLRITDLRNNTEEQFVAEQGYPPNCLVDTEDIIYTRTGNSLGLVFTGRKGVLHNNSFKIVPDTFFLDRKYLFWWLQNPSFKETIINLASRTAQPDITHKLFNVQSITLPILSVQKEFVEKIEHFSIETQRLETIYRQKLAALNELKQSILQKAFTGELTADRANQTAKAAQEVNAA